MDKKFEFKPAADLNLSFKQRIRSAQRERSIFSLGYSLIWWSMVRTIMKLYFRFSVSGKQHIPQSLPFIMVANHSSHLDVVSLMLATRFSLRDRLFPLAAKDHFFEKTTKAAFTAYAINALPVSRQGGGVEAMQELRARMIEQKCGYVIFPEGTRSRNGLLSAFKSGVGILVAGTDIPVVPCYLKGAFEAYPPSAKCPRPKKVELIIGKPLIFSDVVNDKEGCSAIARQLEESVRLLGHGMGL